MTDRGAADVAMNQLLPIVFPRLKIFARRNRWISFSDLEQESRIVIWQCARTFAGDHVGGYIDCAVRNTLSDLLTAHLRRANQASLDAVSADGDTPLADLVTASQPDVGTAMQNNEDAQAILDRLQETLSPLEFKAFRMRVMFSFGYDQIGEQLSVTPKSVDNAIDRATRKLRIAGQLRAARTKGNTRAQRKVKVCRIRSRPMAPMASKSSPPPPPVLLPLPLNRD